MHPMGGKAIADATSPGKFPSELPHRLHGSIFQTSDAVHVVMVCVVITFHSFNLSTIQTPFPAWNILSIC